MRSAMQCRACGREILNDWRELYDHLGVDHPEVAMGFALDFAEPEMGGPAKDGVKGVDGQSGEAASPLLQ